MLVSRERMLQAAGKYTDQRVVVLNFASVTNPGGVTRGSSTQEEALCGRSTLSPCLLGDELWRNYYQMHRDRHDAAYTDICIYVLIIKTDTDAPRRLPEDKMQTVDVITCAAPNLRERPSNTMNPAGGSPVHLSRQDIYSLHTHSPQKTWAWPPCTIPTCCRSSPTLFAPWNSQSTARPGTTPTTRSFTAFGANAKKRHRYQACRRGCFSRAVADNCLLYLCCLCRGLLCLLMIRHYFLHNVTCHKGAPPATRAVVVVKRRNLPG